MNRKGSPFSQYQWSLEGPAKRRLVMHILCCGALGLMPYCPSQASWFGSKTRKIDEDKSIFTLKSEVQVNGESADKNTHIRAGDRVRTSNNSKIAVAVAVIAGMLLEVKAVQAYRPRIGQKLVDHVIDFELVLSLLEVIH